MAPLLACVPELDPVKATRAYLEKHELANLGLHTIAEHGAFARNRLEPMHRRPRLLLKTACIGVQMSPTHAKLNDAIRHPQRRATSQPPT